MNYNEILAKISEETNLSSKVVDRVFKAYWLFIRSSIQALPLKENLSEEDFLKLRTNFNIPSLGKLTCTYEDYLSQKKRYKYITTLKNKDDTKIKKDKTPF